jgi:Domain of unknown function (DUF4365)
MDPNEQKQQFSVAIARAVAAVSGLAYATPDTDDDSIDATIARRGGGGSVRSPKLDLQLKCTSGYSMSGDSFSYPLPVKNYDELRATDLMVPRILVVALVPPDVANWVTCSHASVILRNCAYWVSLRGLPATINSQTISISMQGSQPFDPAQLSAIFAKLSSGGLP